MFVDFRESETSMWETLIFWQLPPECTPARGIESKPRCALTGNPAHNLLVYGTMLQPAEPPNQSGTNFIEMWKQLYLNVP